jgi:hypothetical protein
MQSQSKQVPVCVERVVALFVLDHPGGCSRAELDGELHDLDREAVSAAVSGLAAVGVVSVEGEKVRASECIRHLDALNLISA